MAQEPDPSIRELDKLGKDILAECLVDIAKGNYAQDYPKRETIDTSNFRFYDPFKVLKNVFKERLVSIKSGYSSWKRR